MAEPHDIIFLFDLDNTRLDTMACKGPRGHLEKNYGVKAAFTGLPVAPGAGSAQEVCPSSDTGYPSCHSS
jgi:hypothetical protein